MRRLLVAGLVCVTAMAATKTIWRTDKPDAIARLNGDLKQAISGATLNAKQRKELQSSQQALQSAVDAHENSRSFDSAAVEKAYKTIDRMAKADVFPAQDKKTVEKDLGKLKDTVVRPPPRRRRNTDPMGFPRRW